VDRIKYKNRISICACKVSLDIVGDKWSLIIVRDLFRGRYTYSQFLNESNEGIASNILNDRLKKLIEYQIINFRINPQDKKIKEYYLTDRGIDLYDVIYELQSWTIDNVDFNYSKNTEEFIELNQSKSKKVIISNNKKKYIKLRLEKFGE
jgi:DNA-binding HxlR family transcriptional regulator